MLVVNPMTGDARVEREAAALAVAGHDVAVLATWQEGLPMTEHRRGFTIHRRPYRRTVRDRVVGTIKHYRVAARRSRGGPVSAAAARVAAETARLAGGAALRLMRSRLLPIEYWSTIQPSIGDVMPRPDAVHAHDLGTLASACRIAASDPSHRTAVIYDSHELYLEQTDAWTAAEKQLWSFHERRWIGRADAVITVSDGIADELVHRYGLAHRPTVILNTPETEPATSDVRQDLGLDPGVPLAVYTGAAKRSRNLGVVVEALPLLPAWHLAIVGTTIEVDAARLTAHASGLGVGDRLHLLPAVPSSQVCGYIATADVGVHPLPPGLRNHELALPNKLFEYVFAGLPVAVSNLPEMHGFVRSTGTGAVFDPTSPRSAAAAMREALPVTVDPDMLLPYAWERQAGRLVELYGRLLPAEAGPQTEATVAAS